MISRATLLLMFNQGLFLLSGFLVNSGLARVLQPVDYGTFGLVMSILIVVELFVITGIPELLQKYGGEHPESMFSMISKTLPWQIIYTIAVFAIFWLIAPLLAGMFGQPGLTFYLRIAGIDIIVYGLYKYFLAVQNGLHKFNHYTALGITYSFSKLIGILGLIWLGFSITGALIGNMIGSLVALVLSLFFSRLPKSNVEPEPASFFSFVAHNAFYFVGFNLFFSVDLWFVKYYLSGESVGHYVSAGVLAKITYLMSVALSAVLLPSLARTMKLQQTERTNEMVKDSLRYLIIALLLINTVIILNAGGIIKLFFGNEYISAAPILKILIAGLSMLTVMAVINTIMIANNQMNTCLYIILFLLVLDTGLNHFLVPRYALYGAAVSTSIVGLVGMVLCGLYLFSTFKSLLFSWSTIRLAGITLLVFFIFNLTDGIQLDVILKSVLVGLVYILLLWLTCEINAVDLRRLKESVGG